MFRESLNDGLTWTVPVKIYDANLPGDTLSAFGGISMVYLADVPCVTFEVSVYDGVKLYPRSRSYIYFWKRDLNYGLARKIAGPDNVPFIQTQDRKNHTADTLLFADLFLENQVTLIQFIS
ncbi:MAG TPA: hypothetical protein PKC58_12600 [Ignavibacteria bacterium]|nr:hypothetical protein [Ignavibacteria bacterium]